MDPLRALSDRSWNALIALLEPKTLPLSAQDPPIKPDQVVGPESTVVSICLYLSIWRGLYLKRVAIMCYGARSWALRAPEPAESPVLLIVMLVVVLFFF